MPVDYVDIWMGSKIMRHGMEGPREQHVVRVQVCKNFAVRVREPHINPIAEARIPLRLYVGESEPV